jgi:LysR family glycine cleavage system transcriptional activator
MVNTPRPTTVTLQAFECAARNGSFTRAAIELNVTQGAISRQIRQLETQLGVRLFERVQQRVVLTEVGRRYRDDVRRALDQLEHATERVMACVDVDHVVTVAVAPTFSSNWLAPRVSAFSAAYPLLTINCLMWLPRFDVGVDQFDAAIQLGSPKRSNLEVSHLLDSDLFPMCSPSYRATLRLRGPSDLLRARLLHQINRPTAWGDWFAAQGLAAADTLRGPRFELIAMLMDAAVAGVGVALLPACLTERECADGTLTILPSHADYRGEAYYLVIPESKRQLPRVQAFRQWILAEARLANSLLRERGPRRA